jgi:hypothetical protein
MQQHLSDEHGPVAGKRKRNVQKLTNGDRKWIVKRKISHPTERFIDMQQAFKLERNPEVELKSGTVSGIVKQSEKWLSIADGQETGTRTRSSKEPELEAALYAWRQHQLQGGGKVRDEDLRDKARELAAAMGINTDRSDKGLSFSSGWLDRFKKRNSIQQSRYNRAKANKDDERQDGGAFTHLDANNLPAIQDAGLQQFPQILQSPAGVVHLTPALPHTAPLAHDDTVSLAQPAAIPQPQTTLYDAHQSQQSQAVVPPPYVPSGSFDGPPAAPQADGGLASANPAHAASDRSGGLPPPPPAHDLPAIPQPPPPGLDASISRAADLGSLVDEPASGRVNLQPGIIEAVPRPYSVIQRGPDLQHMGQIRHNHTAEESEGIPPPPQPEEGDVHIKAE